MLYRTLADGVLLFHFAYVVFAVLGGLLVLRSPAVAWLHVPAAAWAALVELAGWICPLTPLENELRQLGGQAGYGGGFIEYYLLSLLYPSGLTREVQIALGLLVVSLNLAVYWRAIRGRGARRLLPAR